MGAPTIHVAGQASPRINGWPFVGGYGTKLADPASLPAWFAAGNSQCLAQSPDEAFVGIAHLLSPFVTIYAWDGAAYGAKVADPATAIGATLQANSLAWSPDGAWLAVGFDVPPYVCVYAWSPSGFGARSVPTGLPASAVTVVAWSPDGAWLACGHDVAPYLLIYPMSAGAFGAPIQPS